VAPVTSFKDFQQAPYFLALISANNYAAKYLKVSSSTYTGNLNKIGTIALLAATIN
jgi:hypothetical protein